MTHAGVVRKSEMLTARSVSDLTPPPAVRALTLTATDPQKEEQPQPCQDSSGEFLRHSSH